MSTNDNCCGSRRFVVQWLQGFWWTEWAKARRKRAKKKSRQSGVLNVVGNPAVRHSSINVGCSSGTFKYDICTFCSPFLTVFFLFPSLDAATIRQPFGPFRNTAASFEADLNTTQCRRFSTSLYWFSPFAPCPTLSLYPSCFSFNFPDSTIFSVCALPQPVLFSCYCSYWSVPIFSFYARHRKRAADRRLLPTAF